GGAQRRPGGAGAGLSLCTASRDDPHSPAARDDSELLAHPVAESRILRHLSLAARDRPGHARQHHPGLSYALSLQELHRDGRSLPGGAHRARALDDLLSRAGHAGRKLPDSGASAVRTIGRFICWPSTTITMRSPSCTAPQTWAW